MISGLLPVGRPSTNGFSGVGLKLLIRAGRHGLVGVENDFWFGVRMKEEIRKLIHTDNVLRNVTGDTLGIFSNDDTPRRKTED